TRFHLVHQPTLFLSSRFKHTAQGETISSLEALPEKLKDFIDLENIPENVPIQRNHSVAYSTLSKEMKDKGVIFTDIFTALREHEDRKSTRTNSSHAS